MTKDMPKGESQFINGRLKCSETLPNQWNDYLGVQIKNSLASNFMI